jgi:Coenzyme PQQ synthesis protein D (PqqD)
MNHTSSTVWQKNPVLAWREIDGETVIISPNESVMHELNDTGSFIWKNIDGRHSTSELATLVVGCYEVPQELALADTEALLHELASKKLVLATKANADGGAD